MRRPSISKAHQTLRTRDELRAFLLTELPGWDTWLTVRAAQIQQRAWDEVLLRPEEDLIQEIARCLDEIVRLFGKEGERVFLPYAQLRPEFEPAKARGATVAAQETRRPSADATTTNALTWQTLARVFNQIGRLPSPAFVGLLGAWAVVRRRHQAGRPRNHRLDHALEHVIDDLAPFSRSRLLRRSESPPVVPPHDCRDEGITQYRSTAVPVKLCALVAVYLALPNREDPEYVETDADPTKHLLPSHAVKDAEKEFSARLKLRAEKSQTQPPTIDLSFLDLE